MLPGMSIQDWMKTPATPFWTVAVYWFSPPTVNVTVPVGTLFGASPVGAMTADRVAGWPPTGGFGFTPTVTATVGGWNSPAPMSTAEPTTRRKPRWSVETNPLTAAV